MIYALYILSFVPIIVIVLTWHELGHLIAAKLCGVKVSGFSIGVFPRILHWHTGNTVVLTDAQTLALGKSGRWPRPGQTARIYATQNPSGQYLALGIGSPNDFKIRNQERNNLDPAELDRQKIVRQCCETGIEIIGKVKKVEPGRLHIADMNWSLGLIMIAAAVQFPVDPTERVKNAYNATHWIKRMFIMLNGVAANMVLAVLAVVVVSALPAPQIEPTLVVKQVNPNSPAAASGLRDGDSIVSAGGHIMPGARELRLEIQRALHSETPAEIKVRRGGQELPLTVKPDPETGLIGIFLSTSNPRSSGAPETNRPRLAERSVTNTVNLYQGFYQALTGWVQGDDPPPLVGPIGAAVQTGNIVQWAGLHGWLLTLAVLSVGIAILNMLPVPPLDGGRVAILLFETLRGGKSLTWKTEHIIITFGFCLMAIGGGYLVYQDLFELF